MLDSNGTPVIAILGTGNIGGAIARGLAESGQFRPERIILTRRHTANLANFAASGFATTDDNIDAVKRASAIIVAVEPKQTDRLLDEIAPALEKRHTLISVVSGVTIAQLSVRIGNKARIVRAMPNTAIAIRESMTCIAAVDSDAVEIAKSIFSTVGHVQVIEEEQMLAATALGACGVAFFLRAVRAASQGGVEIGFHYKEALAIAAQTARGAASLLLANNAHPEQEIDRVTTPRGCTIAGLNRMEHEGFSSAMIKGITTSADKAGRLYED